ncbi:hypothetical protein QBC46DRAFT_370752 [Diplogelasinospora grovesii]|uniref:Uncharacterized protein n=1 Tax=Diplogelasinospora grovesii TaxID=303347 RepID=A0AAN6SA40_9PEZI|nr:hypothetical protein QBC46DRAFT_370752 [Diplogelasinospora grovesii]
MMFARAISRWRQRLALPLLLLVRTCSLYPVLTPSRAAISIAINLIRTVASILYRLPESGAFTVADESVKLGAFIKRASLRPNHKSARARRREGRALSSLPEERCF